ncbi:MAG: two-component regulator propeller domain-containing protein [Bacteroidota bacterium]
MRKSIAVSFFFLLYTLCTAQSFDQLDIRYMNSQQGLSDNFTHCFYEDSKGFLWIGTEDGLNRYDGNSVKIYRQNHSDRNSLPGNNIYSICGDDSNGIWVYASRFIVHFLPDEEKVIDYTDGLLNGKTVNLGGYYGKLFHDGYNELCLINEHGISVFDKTKNKFQLYTMRQPINTNADVAIIDYFQEDKNNLLLLTNNGLLRYNTVTHNYRYLQFTVDFFSKTLPFISLSDFVKADDGRIWVTSTNHGLLIFDEKENQAQQFLLDYKPTDPTLQNSIYFIAKPTAGTFKNDIVIGTAGYGLFIVKPGEQHPFRGFAALENSNNISDHQLSGKLLSTMCLFTNRNEVSFIGNDAGVFSINPSNQIFTKHKNQFNGWVSGIVKKYTPANELRYYFSSFYGGGFHIFDQHLNKIKSYSRVPPDNSKLQNSNVNSLYADRQNQLWVCTSSGLYLYDEVDNSFKPFLHDKNNSNSIKCNKIATITQDHSGIFWIGFFAGGFQCYDPVKNIFFDIDLQTPCRDNAYVFNILEDSQYNIWIGRDKGIVKINRERNKFVQYFSDLNDSAGLSNDEVQSFLLDKQKRLWIGTKNGLNLYLPKSNTFKKYFRENGLYNDFIYCLAQDKNGNIWAGAGYSVCVINPQTDKINIYKNVNAVNLFCDSNGDVIIASGGAPINFLTCNQDMMKEDTLKPLPYITNVKIIGEDKVVKNISTLNLKDIMLGYKENYLTFDFTGVSYNDASQNQFKCKLEGLQSGWKDIGKTRSISYAALMPGEYTFKVMCSNTDGIWNDDIATLHISILPPYWKTWWFKILLTVFFATAVYYIYLQRIKKIKTEEGIKTKLAQLETQALMAQMNPHFVFNALNSIQACIVSNNNDAAYKYLNKFSLLVRSILQNSREQFITLSNELEVLKNYMELEQLRFKDLEFTFRMEEKINAAKIKVPSAFLQPFVENAIIHGLAHREGNKRLEIIISETGADIIFKIIDNGIGRKKSAEINQNRTKSHTSIGMNLVSSRLKLINEQYGIKSEVSIVDLENADHNSTGTEVIIILPKALQEELF